MVVGSDGGKMYVDGDMMDDEITRITKKTKLSLGDTHRAGEN